jgi:hypothetical protein
MVTEGEKYHGGIVIPSHREGIEGIVRTLTRCAIWVEQLEDKTRWAIFVVINQSTSAWDDVSQSNQATCELLTQLVSGGVISLPHVHPQVAENIAKFWRERARVDIFMIDAFTEGYAPEICTVWIARTLWLQIALRLVDKDGFIMITDADTLPGRTYFTDGLFCFRHNPEIDMLTGPVHVYEGTQDTRHDRIEKIEALWRELLEIPYLPFWENNRWNYIPETVGANMFFRRGIAEKVDSFPPVNGGEDVLFGMKVAAEGFNIRSIRNTAVWTSPRVSTRTEERHWYGQRIGRLESVAQDIHTPYLADGRFLFVKHELWYFFGEYTIHNREKWVWVEMVWTRLQKCWVTIEKEQVENWYDMLKEFEKYPGRVFHPVVRVEIETAIRNAYPQVSLVDGAREILTTHTYIPNTLRLALQAELDTIGRWQTDKNDLIRIEWIFMFFIVLNKIYEFKKLLESEKSCLQNQNLYDHFMHRQKILEFSCERILQNWWSKIITTLAQEEISHIFEQILQENGMLGAIFIKCDVYTRTIGRNLMRMYDIIFLNLIPKFWEISAEQK